jgi:large subunit ribosomal protein L25
MGIISPIFKTQGFYMLEGIVRESIGKKGTKALRRDGYLIANIYGKGLENINAAFKENEYIRTVRNKETLAFPVNVAGKEINVVVQSYESHPLTGKLLHVDLMVAQPGVVTHFMVPVEAVGEAIGLKNKGLVNIAKKRLRVKAKIEDLPKAIVIDVTEMDVGDSKLIRDIATTKEVKFTDADRVSVLSIIKAK